MPKSKTAPEREAWNVRGTVAKLDVKKRRVFGWASVITDENGEHTFDHQGTLIPTEELEEASYEYVMKAREAGEMHARVGVGKLIASVVMTPEVRKAMDLPEEGKTGWFIGFEVSENDPAWPKIASGEYSEFSIGGSAIKEAA